MVVAVKKPDVYTYEWELGMPSKTNHLIVGGRRLFLGRNENHGFFFRLMRNTNYYTPFVAAAASKEYGGEEFVKIMKEAQPYFVAHRGSIFVLLLSADINDSTFLSSILEGGVQRVHLLDATIGGVLLKELFQRYGVGTMVASDLYEGARMAKVSDIPGIKQLLQPLEESGTLIRRTEEELVEALHSFIVVERE